MEKKTTGAMGKSMVAGAVERTIDSGAMVVDTKQVPGGRQVMH